MYARVFVKVLFMGTLLVCLSGCGGRQELSLSSVIMTPAVQVEEFPNLTPEELARLHDMSFPLNVQPKKLLFTETQMVLTYTTELSQEELRVFYHTSMDYWGWEELGIVMAPESCLMFAKPSKLCTIVLRSEGTQTSVTLFTTLKQ